MTIMKRDTEKIIRINVTNVCTTKGFKECLCLRIHKAKNGLVIDLRHKETAVGVWQMKHATDESISE